jgi:hypothetical protein
MVPPKAPPEAYSFNPRSRAGHDAAAAATADESAGGTVEDRAWTTVRLALPFGLCLRPTDGVDGPTSGAGRSRPACLRSGETISVPICSSL